VLKARACSAEWSLLRRTVTCFVGTSLFRSFQGVLIAATRASRFARLACAVLTRPSHEAQIAKVEEQ
jgi:hypothetical protein